jgi:type VI secretion system lysozyme-like protein
MSLPKAQDRLQPALLDRLRDDEPTKQHEPAENRVLSRNRLRDAVLRDLSWLFNTAQFGSSESLDGYPEVGRSVLNFGLPIISGQTISSIDHTVIEAQVRQAIVDHEPRILTDTLRVEALLIDEQIGHHNQISGSAVVVVSTGAARIVAAHRCRPGDRAHCGARSVELGRWLKQPRGRPTMDPRLLQYYNQELAHLREMGAEFALQFPKIAARLRMDGIEVGDPYVERLLEGFAFLASRIQLKMDAEFPRFTERLLEIVYPNYLQPTPSMLVTQLQPILGDAALAAGVSTRGSELPRPHPRHPYRVSFSHGA